MYLFLASFSKTNTFFPHPWSFGENTTMYIDERTYTDVI